MIVKDIQFDRAEEFDLAVGVCGYEPRSSHVCRVGVRAGRKIAIVYRSTEGDEFDRNRENYSSNGWTLVEEPAVLQFVRETLRGIDNPRILVDISSMARRTMAIFVQELWENPRVGDVQFTYSPPRYESSLEAASVVPSLRADPITDYFAGALRSPSIPVGLVLGLGLEPHRASGLIELIEPTRLWAFAALSDDERFIEDLREMHAGLIDESSGSMMLYYDIRSLSGVYNSIESLAFASSLEYRLLIAPSGPKLFTLASLLVGAPRTSTRPAIWRVGSSTPSASLSSVVEAGDIVAAQVDFAGATLRPQRSGGSPENRLHIAPW